MVWKIWKTIKLKLNSDKDIYRIRFRYFKGHYMEQELHGIVFQFLNFDSFNEQFHLSQYFLQEHDTKNYE